MNGTTHVAIGVAVASTIMHISGTTFSVYGNDIYTPMILATSVAGSLLPDIDHHNSYATNASGVVGKVISKTSKHRGFWHSWIPLAGLIAATVYSAGLADLTPTGMLIATGFAILMCLGAAYSIVSGKKKKRNLMQKGVYIIIAFSLFLLVAKGFKLNAVATSLFGGITIGYASHIVADMLNVDGVQLLWPLPMRADIPFISIPTGSFMEKVVAFGAILVTIYNIVYGGLL